MIPRPVRALLAAAIFMSAIPTWAANGNGMTWAKFAHNSSNGADEVGCYGCNAYSGDTDCSNNLPVLCYKYDGSSVPPGLTPDFFNGWKYGHIAVTLPIQGNLLTSLSAANQICEDYFGSGYEIAEFHHSLGGWNWWAFGNVRSDTRFWAYINDQPANCWD